MKPLEHLSPSLDDLLSLAVECHAIDRYRQDGEIVWIQMAEEEYRIPFDSVVLFLETVIHYRRRLERAPDDGAPTSAAAEVSDMSASHETIG